MTIDPDDEDEDDDDIDGGPLITLKATETEVL